MFFESAWHHTRKDNTAHLIFAQLWDMFGKGSTDDIDKSYLITTDVRQFYYDTVFCGSVLEFIEQAPDAALLAWYEYDSQTEEGQKVKDFVSKLYELNSCVFAHLSKGYDPNESVGLLNSYIEPRPFECLDKIMSHFDLCEGSVDQSIANISQLPSDS